MDSDEEIYNDFDDSQETEVEICGKKNSSFEALTAADIADLMNQYIDDVKSIVQVSITVICFLFIDPQQNQCFRSISENKILKFQKPFDSCHGLPFAFC